jgi:hypothetical protein
MPAPAQDAFTAGNSHHMQPSWAQLRWNHPKWPSGWPGPCMVPMGLVVLCPGLLNLNEPRLEFAIFAWSTAQQRRNGSEHQGYRKWTEFHEDFASAKGFTLLENSFLKLLQNCKNGQMGSVKVYGKSGGYLPAESLIAFDCPRTTTSFWTLIDQQGLVGQTSKP